MANSKRLCKNCGTRVRKYIVVNNMAFCTFDSAVKWANENKLIGANKVKKIENKKFNEKKRLFELNDVRHQHKLTQTVFNKLRVLQEIKWFQDQGLEPECISCGKKNMDWCCGHLKSRGSQGNLRYSEMNTFLQCNRYCNMSLSGNIEGNKNTRGYKKGILERFGVIHGGEILEFCEENTSVKKWTGQELVELRIKFNKEIKLLTR